MCLHYDVYMSLFLYCAKHYIYIYIYIILTKKFMIVRQIGVPALDDLVAGHQSTESLRFNSRVQPVCNSGVV